jgi:uncharacterized phage protein (TIGR02216 family)
MSETPWAAWLAHAMAAFRLPPKEFWMLSLREWRALTRPHDAAPLSRADLDRLAARFPD